MHADLALADISLAELPPRWTAIKLLEDDSQVRQRVAVEFHELGRIPEKGTTIKGYRCAEAVLVLDERLKSELPFQQSRRLGRRRRRA